MTSSSDKNVELWTRTNAEYTDRAAKQSWEREEIVWGVWAVPESELEILGDVHGLDVVELGCGTAYCSAWLARRGAHVVGVDPTPAQLETARRMQEEFGLEFRLVQAFGEDVPLPDGSFDLVHSEYGASIWADPYKWIPEAARLLRPGGRLVFLRNSTLSMLCAPDVGQIEERLHRPQFGMYRLDWPENEGAVEYHIPHGELIDLLRGNGLEVERLVELQAPEGAKTHWFDEYVTPEWGRQWPAEEIWVARKPG
jgi:SAM-dependent methyltransferase